MSLADELGAKQPGAREVTFADEPGAHKPGEVFRDCPDCEELVVIPPGDFEMGSNESPSEMPSHHVAIARPFAVGRREVSFAEWDACVAAAACTYVPGDHGWGRADRPVIDVSFNDTKPFLEWMSKKAGHAYRLASEAEWEYAARAGSASKYWWGADVGAGRAKCRECGGDASAQTVPGGSFRPNAFGLFDTTGNAAEWVADCWNATYKGAPHDGSSWNDGDCGLRVLRGGSFGSKASAVRSAARFRYDEDVRYYANGFRVVRDIP
jgi:formylglycine-generating enzyme required for sulfatase activity